MRHIALLGVDRPPCNGIIQYIPGSRHKTASEAAPQHRSLPLLGQNPAPSEAAGEWICTSCGMKWTREPLPQDAL